MRLREDISSWDTAINVLNRNESKQTLNPEIVVPARNLESPRNQSQFEISNILSLDEGAIEVYRHKKAEDSPQVRVYESGHANNINYDGRVYAIQLDQHNPKRGAKQAMLHLIEDVFGINT
jgi:hypothetical protein